MYSALHGSRLRESLFGHDRPSGPGIFSAIDIYQLAKLPLYAPNAFPCGIATSCRNYKKQFAMKTQHCSSPVCVHSLSMPPARSGASNLISRGQGNTTAGSPTPHSLHFIPQHSLRAVANIGTRPTCSARTRSRWAAPCIGSTALGADTDPSTSIAATRSTTSHANSTDSNIKSTNYNARTYQVSINVQMGPSMVDQVNGTTQPNDDLAMDQSNTSAASAAAVASVAAVAVAGAVAAAVPAPPPRTTAVRLIRRVVGLLREHFAAVMLLYAVKDAVAFLLHRVTQRLTNHAAEVLLGTPTSTAGNPWWLYLDPAFIRAHPGYEVIVGLFFLASLPLTIALNSAAFTTAALIATPPGVRQAAATAGGGVTGDGSVTPSLSAAARTNVTADDPAAAVLADLGIVAQPMATASSGGAAAAAVHSVASASAPGSGQVGKEAAATEATATEGAAKIAGPSAGAVLRDAAASIAAVLPAVVAALPRVWIADLQFNVRALPLQGLSLLVLPALWAAPRLLRLQLTLPVAVLEGRPGREALGRSEGLMTSSLTSYGLPFAGLLAAGRMLEYVQGLIMVLVPPRWWREVVEVPLAIAGTFLLLKAAANRLQDLLPLAAYLELSQEQAADAARQQQQLLTPHASKPPTVNSTDDPISSNAEAVPVHATS